MKMKSYNIICSLLILMVTYSSCKKESENTFTIFKGLKIDFNETLADNEAYVEFKLEKPKSGANMSKVVLTETGGNTPVYSKDIAYGERYGYLSGVLILKANDPSTVSYQITVLDDDGNDITSQVTVTYPAGKQVVSDPVLITDKETKSFAAGTMVYIDYSIHSDDANIGTVSLESFATGSVDPARVTIATLPDNVIDAKNYRGATRVTLDRDGKSKFRIFVSDEANDYIGDGYTSINTNVIVSYELSANKFIYAPDSTSTAANPDLSSACFYSISRKRSFNYEEAKAISEDIDFGIYVLPVGNSSLYSLNLYSPNDVSSGNPMKSVYDFSTWTKRKTLFGPATPSVAQPNPLQLNPAPQPVPAPEVFNSRMVSGITINEIVAKGRYATLITRSILTSVSSGSIIFFKNQEGKYGAIFINGFGKDYLGRRYANIDVKIEK